MTFSVLLPVIRQVCETWDDQAEQLRGGRRRLGDAQEAVDALGGRVVAAARAYLATWAAEVDRLAGAAQGRSEDLARLSRTFVLVDEQAADDLRAMLPWDLRDADLGHPLWASAR